MTTMKENKAFYTVLAILISVLAWFGQANYNKLLTIEKELITIKVELVKIQSETLTRDDVIDIVKSELAKLKK